MIAPAMHIEAGLGRLADVRAHVRSTARTLGADERAVQDLVQAVDEWVTNVVVHGYRGEGGPVDLQVERDGPYVMVTIRDEAPVFDPATAPAFDPDLPLEERPFGKMGIALIRGLCTKFDHKERPGGGNEVLICRTAATKPRGRSGVNTTVDRVSADTAVLALEGELDASNFQDLIAQGQGLYGDGVRTLVLDLSGLSYMASSGIVALHSLALVFRGQQPHDPEAGWDAFHAVRADTDSGQTVEQLRLVAPTPAIDSVLERTGLKRILPIYEDRAAAIAG